MAIRTIEMMAARRFAKMLRHAVDVGAIPAQSVLSLTDDLNGAAGDFELAADEAETSEKIDRGHSDLAGLYAEAIENLFPSES
jgi:hypothetical protein